MAKAVHANVDNKKDRQRWHLLVTGPFRNSFLAKAGVTQAYCLQLARNQCGFSAGGLGAVWRGAWRCSNCFC